MVALISSKFRFRKLRVFAKREDGAAAVEFAIVVAPFLALLFAILETALVFFAGQTLETAVSDSARLILTGQAQTASFSLRAVFQSVAMPSSATHLVALSPRAWMRKPRTPCLASCFIVSLKLAAVGSTNIKPGPLISKP